MKNLDGIVFEPVEDTLPKVKLCFRQDWIPQSSSATSKYYVKENMREELTAIVENQMVQPKYDINILSSYCILFCSFSHSLLAKNLKIELHYLAFIRFENHFW